MVEITKHFFFNLCLLLILMFACLAWSEGFQKRPFTRKSAIFFFIASILLCFLFSFNSSSGLRIDLRTIPILIGGLYLGIGPLLSLIAIVVRGLYGIDPGFYINFFFYGTLTVFMWRIHPWFWNQTPRRRITASVYIAIIISFLNVVCIEIVSPPSGVFDLWVAYLIVPPLGVYLITYAIEFVVQNLNMYKQLIKTEKLQAVEQMGAAISHEIRNPLTAAMGFVQLLQETSIEPHKRKQYLSIVKEELESAERVIQDYLTFSKPSLEYIEEVNIKKELRHVLNILQPLANQNSVQISTSFAVLGTIRGDRQKFHQCFLNIIKNAIESMPGGGHLTVETDFNQTSVSVEIKDTGTGMSNEQVKRLGEPYYSTKGAKGTGLGMMVTYGIVRAMDGTIDVKSEIGKGTAFRVSFPAQRHVNKLDN
ncbi:ATP-binding protein [Peribacillus sp. SCS-155]|uniref:ATP-binding protein n=1 Tax=Peribacillus sedimenti TaxID=3115297 RepID=UPI003906CCFA